MPENGMLRYNERAWAIELISHINQNCVGTTMPSVIKRASGEYSLHVDEGVLFPDILLFADQANGKLLQGWELKMPDTPVSDATTIENASLKARSLGLDSFVIWNVQCARLHILNTDTDEYALVDAPLFHTESICTREDAFNHRDIWQNGAREIIIKLDRYFSGGELAGASLEKVFANSNLVNQILSCHSSVKQFINKRMQSDRVLSARINRWWENACISYPGENSPLGPLAYIVLLRWFNRFIFSNILKAYTGSVKAVASIDEHTTITEAATVFNSIAQANAFGGLFVANDFDDLLPPDVWDVLVGFNGFLKDFEFGQIDKSVLNNILKSIVLSKIKKHVGLFVTPDNVARLLVYLSLDDKLSNTIDPFCGTGTIFSAIMDIKSDFNVSGRETVKSTWGSDKFAFPVQMAALAVSAPENMGETIRVFTHDAFTLMPGAPISFLNPASGQEAEEDLPTFSSVISNLPFVQFEDYAKLNPNVNSLMESFYTNHNIEPRDKLSGKSDLYAYVPFLIYDLIEDGGLLGVIISNSWLCTKWGEAFRHLLKKMYEVQMVVVSNNGRWFAEADVVTTFLVCKKSSSPQQSESNFITTNVDINSIDHDELFALSNKMLTSYDCSEISVSCVSDEMLSFIDSLGVSWMPAFCEIDWLKNNVDVFAKATTYFEIGRGERRGWNDLFYPSGADAALIEPQFIKPVIKNLRGGHEYIVKPQHHAFSCLQTLDELKNTGCNGALNWINRFINERNRTGRPLTEVLRRGKLDWYQMDCSTMADFVLSMNPDRHLYVAKTRERAFIDQRLIPFRTKEMYRKDEGLLFAAINSTVSLFFIEASGFGRGLGVLDINATNIKNSLRIPDLSLISKENRAAIISKFAPIKKRSSLPIPDELEQDDRKAFDMSIADAIGFPRNEIKSVYRALGKLYSIRKAVGR